MRRDNITIPIRLYVLATILVCATGCAGSLSDARRDAIVDAYIEVMIAKNMYRDDSVRMRRVTDSIADAFGFDNEIGLRTALSEVSAQTEDLRRVLDSAQRRMERMQSVQPSTPPSKSVDTTTKK